MAANRANSANLANLANGNYLMELPPSSSLGVFASQKHQKQALRL